MKSAIDPQFNLLTFKMLNKSQTGVLSKKEFFDVYKTLEFKWKLKSEEDQAVNCNFRKVISNMVTSKSFELFIYVIIIFNIFWFIFPMSDVGSKILNQELDEERKIKKLRVHKFSLEKYEYIELFFLGIYSLEMIFKVFGLGKSSTV